MRLGASAAYLDQGSWAGDTFNSGSSSLASINVDMGFRAAGPIEIGPLIGLSRFRQSAYEDYNVNIGPQLRYYFREDDKVQPWVSLAAGVSWSKSNYNPNTQFGGNTISDDQFTTFLKYGVGCSFFASEWAAFEVSYSMTDYDDSNLLGDVDGLLSFGISTFF
jgi:hypothetical protein